ncbi:MAG: nickel pincer cofactor biosynthesis protein LarB [Myxococcota bacterium]
MAPADLRRLLERVQAGDVDVEAAIQALADLPFRDLGYAKIDHHRQLRTGIPEVVFGAGKTPAETVGALQELHARSGLALATRVSEETAALATKKLPEVRHNDRARTLVLGTLPPTRARVGVLTGGTSDAPVAEEAAVTLEVLGCEVLRLPDVGVAGLHRLTSQRSTMETCDALIVIAGMEAALASATAGLTTKPIVAVPTSVGYGASFGGLAALLGMLTSCAPGVTVVNIDNGFGAACAIARISLANDD